MQARVKRKTLQIQAVFKQIAITDIDRSVNNNVVPTRCGKILLLYAAISFLHIVRSFSGLFAVVEQTPERQKIVHTKRRSASGDAIEGIFRHHVRDVGQQGFKLAAGVVIEDPVFAPGELSGHQLVLSATQRMKRMGYAELAWGVPQTTCT